MPDFLTYVRLGFHHIVDLTAADHILFLLALAAVYRPRDWRAALWVVSSFTLGHSLTLGLAVTGLVRFPTALVEFLIPLTIVLTCGENLLAAWRGRDPGRPHLRMLLAGGFGLVHGAGFATYLQSLFVSPIAVPLFGFNCGIELGQLTILLGIGAGLVAADALLRRLLAAAPPLRAYRARVFTLSAVVAVLGAHMAAQRLP